MIYKIEIKKKLNFSDIMKSLSNIGDYCSSGKMFFVNTDKQIPEVKKIIGDSDIDISEIKPTYDLSACSDLVKEWCKSRFEKEALYNFEHSEDGQKRMKEIMLYLTAVEEKRRREEVEKNAKSKSKRAERNQSEEGRDSDSKTS